MLKPENTDVKAKEEAIQVVVNFLMEDGVSPAAIEEAVEEAISEWMATHA